MQPYQDAVWNGLLDGVPTRVNRSGFSDISVRFTVNLLGGPPLSRDEFAAYKAATQSDTIVAVGLEIQLPTGNYLDDKLLNLGTNRYTFRPQAGVVHNQDKWSAELTASTRLYSDNDEFFNGNYLEQNPLHTIQGYVDFTIRPGLWVGAGIAYGNGGESTLNGIHKDDPRDSLVWGPNVGYAFSTQVSAQVAYISQRTLTAVGADSDSIAATLSVNW